MSALAAGHERAGLILPALLLAGVLGLIGWQTGVIRLPVAPDPGRKPETVTIAPRVYTYRAVGGFLRGGTVVDGPLVKVDVQAPLEIMTYQVSVGEYGRCVADRVCKAAEPRRHGDGDDLPVTGVSYDDATDYAAWLSAGTGQTWRLPTVAEWVFAAGDKAVDQALGIATDAGNPAERWIAAYEQEAAASGSAPSEPLPRGAGGINAFGVADLSAAVWEWTASCDSRTTLGADGAVLSRIDSCGVHQLEGRHRTAISNFVRDAAGGGCSVGVPPDNLGFRLVRDRGGFEGLVDLMRGLFA